MSNASRTLSVQSPAIPLFLGQLALKPVRLSGREGLSSPAYKDGWTDTDMHASMAKVRGDNQ
ncbi:hypothetical protein [Variovorax boronicumulans]